ncbi:hypothetical protein MHU86_4523 [Fragilaria crotonensis]|nr:hypothetical protein MHU86_4523 [Fragilaria crotonensis]
MSAWGAAAKSCNALLLRVEQNDPSLTELVILPSKTFGGPEVERLAAALGRNTHLTTLSASGHAVPPASLKILGKALATTKFLKKVALGDKNMGNEGVLALVGETGFGVLEVVDLAFKNISEDGMAVLGAALGRSCFLKDIDLSRNPVGNAGLVTFCEAAGDPVSLSTLQNVNLSECQIGAVGMESLAKLLVQTSCTSLGLASNPLGPLSASSLAALIQDGKLQMLVLESCELGDEGLAELCQKGIPSGVQILDLSNNGIGNNSAINLAKMLSSWDALSDLKLANNLIGEEGMLTVSTALTCTEALDATNTDCGVQGATSLIRATGLKRLRLFNNKLRSNGFQAIAAIISETNLLELDLGGNEATSGDMLTLLRKIRMSERISLNLLEIGANETSMEVEEEINRIKEVHPHLDIARDRARLAV